MRVDKSRQDNTGLGLKATATLVKTLHWIASRTKRVQDGYNRGTRWVQKGHKMGTIGVQDGYNPYREAGYNQGRQDRTGLEAAAAPVQANHVRHQSRQGSIKSTFSFLGGAV